MEIMLICMTISIVIYLTCNIFWHKKIIEGKWEYTIYSTIVLIIYIIFALTNLSLV